MGPFGADGGGEDPLVAERKRLRRQHAARFLRHPLGFLAALAAAATVFWVVWAPVPLLLALGVAALAWGHARAGDEWWLLLLRHLGMEPDVEQVGKDTPLLRSGDKRKVLRAGTDGRRRLLVFRRTEVSTDSKGNRTESHHDYTVVVYADSDPPIRYLSAHEHRVSWAKWLGDDLVGRKARNVDEVSVESLALHERWELRSSEEDAAVVREIFQPSTILWFTQLGMPFEYEMGHLVVIARGELSRTAAFQHLLHRADQIHAAIHGTPPKADGL